MIILQGGGATYVMQIDTQNTKKQNTKKYKKIQHCHSSNDIKYQKFAKLQDQKENQFESVSLLLELLLFKQSLEKIFCWSNM